MSRHLITQDDIPSMKDLRRKLDEYEAQIADAAMLGRKHSLRIAACLWNIREHKLFRAAGVSSMAQYGQQKGIAHKTIYNCLAKGQGLAKLAFDENTPMEQRWLSQTHVDLFIEAEKQKTLTDRNSRIRLLGDGMAITQEGDDADIDDAIDQIEADGEMEALGSEFYRLSTERRIRRNQQPPRRKERSVELFEYVTKHAKSLSIGVWDLARLPEFKRRRTLHYRALAYYTRLAYWFLNFANVPGTEIVEFEDAMDMEEAYQEVPDQIPLYVRFALGHDTQTPGLLDSNAVMQAE